MAVVEMTLLDATKRERERFRSKAARVLQERGMHTRFMTAEHYGAPLDARYVFGFGRRLRLPATLPAAVPRTLLNFILPTKGGYGLETVDRSSVPGPGDAPTKRRAVEHEGAFLPHGLLPSWDPGAKVYCPTVYHPGKFAVRPLEIEELLRVYQLPLAMDAALSRRNASRLPFADSPPPEMYAALLRLM